MPGRAQRRRGRLRLPGGDAHRRARRASGRAHGSAGDQRRHPERHRPDADAPAHRPCPHDGAHADRTHDGGRRGRLDRPHQLPRPAARGRDAEDARGRRADGVEAVDGLPAQQAALPPSDAGGVRRGVPQRRKDPGRGLCVGRAAGDDAAFLRRTCGAAEGARPRRSAAQTSGRHDRYRRGIRAAACRAARGRTRPACSRGTKARR